MYTQLEPEIRWSLPSFLYHIWALLPVCKGWSLVLCCAIAWHATGIGCWWLGTNNISNCTQTKQMPHLLHKLRCSWRKHVSQNTYLSSSTLTIQFNPIHQTRNTWHIQYEETNQYPPGNEKTYPTFGKPENHRLKKSSTPTHLKLSSRRPQDSYANGV